MTSLQFDPDRDVFDLNEHSLTDVFFQINESRTPASFIERKNHVQYFENYLGKSGLDANFVVAERSYINKDYLTDYSLYYSSCFSIYGKLCTRLHFFSLDENKESFNKKFQDSIIDGFHIENNKQFIDRHYLGYMVVKPTPNYFIGFTLLRHLNFNESKSSFCKNRNFWGIKDYDVHIYGNRLSIKSLAFQEQDKNVAACATIAIWTMFQRAAEDYYVVLRSPIQITHETGITAHDGNRLIPNKGLSIRQMAHAITKNNLVTEAIDFQTYRDATSFNSYVKKIIYAYSPIKIPVILAIGFRPIDVAKDGHAVSILGYHLQDINSIVRKNRFYNRILEKSGMDSIATNTIWNADRIDEIYVHDDQWGPFATMFFSGKRDIHSNWDSENPKNAPCVTQSILISLFPKIRIPYDTIEYKVKMLNGIIRRIFNNNMIWSIQLFLSEEFKSSVQKNSFSAYESSAVKQLKFDFLTKNFPKYIWVATLLKEDEEKIFDFIYDATGLSSSNIIHTIVGYFPPVTKMFVELLNKNVNEFSLLLDHDVISYVNATME